MKNSEKMALPVVILACTMWVHPATADSFYVQTFATGSAVGGSSPDSVEFGDGSLWIAYQNNAPSTGGGASTIVRYSPSGSVIHTWSISGNVDGLRVDPATGLVWALQNNDANAALTVINPVTNGTKAYSYGTSYTANGNSLTRGFDDAVFQNGQVFLSETNPSKGTDPVITRLTNGLGSAPLQIAGVLDSTFTGLNLATGKVGVSTITDSDSLIKTPSGDLALTGEADQEIVLIHDAGTPNQSESFLHLLGTNGRTIVGDPDDTAYATATQGFFYLSDTGANKVYRVSASGLTLGSVFVDVGAEFGSLDLSTGVVTPIFSGVSPHGVQFVPEATATPEPATRAFVFVGVAFSGSWVAIRRKKDAPQFSCRTGAA